jgi:hypothetical protein
MSLWIVFLSRLVMAAGFSAALDASLPTMLPAFDLPMFLTLCSRSWKPEAAAWPAAKVPTTASASAVARMRRVLLFIRSSP